MKRHPVEKPRLKGIVLKTRKKPCKTENGHGRSGGAVL